MPHWYFTLQRPNDKIREPIQGEFFANESISRPGEALVREGIQNSLDAAAPGQAIMVRIFVSGRGSEVAVDDLAPFLPGAWEHFGAPGNGLANPPRESDTSPFLVFEDFGTVGLQGDPGQYDPDTSEKNDFLHFFRAEGRSEKSEQDRGRWGVGKYVFAQASRANAIFGVTVRQDDERRLLMGQAVLRSHRVNGTRYKPDGWFGEIREDELVMPVEDQGILDRFCALFDLQRGNEPGLSIVVPWYDLDMTDERLVEAVVRDYFFPILTGKLEVWIEAPNVKTIISKDSIGSVLDEIGDPVAAELQPLLDLVIWAREQNDEDIAKLNLPSVLPYRPVWDRELIPENVVSSIREALDDGNPVALRVPLLVRRKEAQPEPSFFDVFFLRDHREHAGRPIFIREGIIISDIRVPRTRGICALVVIEDKPLATLLGDAENPAHTRWENGANFRDKYTYGKSYVTFVTTSVNEIVRIINAADQQEDPVLLIDFFSLTAPPSQDSLPAPAKKPSARPGTQSTGPTQLPLPQPQKFLIHRITGGFTVTRNEGAAISPFIEILTAYDTRRGNPLGKYVPSDFDLGKSPIQLDPKPQGISVVDCARNRLVVAVQDPAFSISVRGFDENRDLYLKVVPRENVDGN